MGMKRPRPSFANPEKARDSGGGKAEPHTRNMRAPIGLCAQGTPEEPEDSAHPYWEFVIIGALLLCGVVADEIVRRVAAKRRATREAADGPSPVACGPYPGYL